MPHLNEGVNMKTIAAIWIGIIVVLFATGILVIKDPKAPVIEKHELVPVGNDTFTKSLNTCHALKLSLHSVTDEPVCLKPHDNGKCDLYGTKTELRCGDDRIKDLHDTTIIFITQAAD
jgi:hypothetical protein